MTTELPEPKSRKESYLAKAAGVEVSELPTPESREELYLNAIAENGGGGGGGTSDFEQLTNRPKYNGTTMTGDTNIPEVVNSAFTGTDGTAAGTAGLVPAPATTDAGKFLKADGTWDSAGGSSAAVVLTSADNNHHSTGDSDDGIAVWKFDRGYYKVIGPAKVYWTTGYFDIFAEGASQLFIIGHNSYMGISGNRQVIRPGAMLITGETTLKGFYTWSVRSDGTSSDYNISNKNGYFLSGENVVQSTGTSNTTVMSQKAVTDIIGDVESALNIINNGGNS